MHAFTCNSDVQTFHGKKFSPFPLHDVQPVSATLAVASYIHYIQAAIV